MLQLASATATLVSGGQRFKPRLVREIHDVAAGTRQPVANQALPALPFDAEHVALIKRALHGVTQEGTSTRVFVGAPYASGGKTGTAQAVGVRQGERYNAAKLEEHQRDHSLYIAAAPIDAPTVALAVIVENSGFGAEAAAPIARRVFDYLLAGLVPSEEDLAAVRIGKAAAPIGKPKSASEVAWPAPAASAAAAGVAPPARVAAAAVADGAAR
jgi:penicillin-binding protein 2